jgi:hypothetical protein
MTQFARATPAAPDYDSTIIGALELNEKKWVLALQLPKVKRHSCYGMDASRFSASIVCWLKEGNMPLKLLAIDLGKRSFHIHGIDRDGVIISRKTSRSKLVETIEDLASETVAMGACASAHYWGRRFIATGYRVLLINRPRFAESHCRPGRTRW